MKEEDYSKAIEVFSGSPWEAEIIKGLLESNNIRCVIKDGIMGTLAPYIAPSVSVLVTEEEYEAATELIRSRDEKADEPSGGGGLRGVRLARDGDLADDVLPEGEKEDHVGEYPLDPAGRFELPAGGELLQRAHPRPRHQLYVERARF